MSKHNNTLTQKDSEKTLNTTVPVFSDEIDTCVRQVCYVTSAMMMAVVIFNVVASLVLLYLQ